MRRDVRVCERACVRACVHARVCARACAWVGECPLCCLPEEVTAGLSSGLCASCGPMPAFPAPPCCAPWASDVCLPGPRCLPRPLSSIYPLDRGSRPAEQAEDQSRDR